MGWSETRTAHGPVRELLLDALKSNGVGKTGRSSCRRVSSSSQSRRTRSGRGQANLDETGAEAGERVEDPADLLLLNRGIRTASSIRIVRTSPVKDQISCSSRGMATHGLNSSETDPARGRIAWEPACSIRL